MTKKNSLLDGLMDTSSSIQNHQDQQEREDGQVKTQILFQQEKDYYPRLHL